MVGRDGRISLYDNNQVLIQTQSTDSLGKAYFAGIQADTGYSIQANSVTSNPSKIYGNEYWGERRGLTISGAETTAVAFMRNAPYTSNIKVYDKNTDEVVSGNIPFGTPLKVSIEITNPNEQGSVPAISEMCSDAR